MSEQEVFDRLKYRIEVSEYGTRMYYNTAGQLHCTVGPAIEWADGGKAWYQNGLRHRTDGPAVEYSNGEKWWYQDNRLHRTDGPAIKYPSGRKEWWVNGSPLTEEEFNRAVKQNV